MKAVIYQPTYLPWIGFFGMLDIADIFVFYDDVQFIRQSWQRRNRIKFQNSEKWLRVPIIKNYPQKINQVQINNSTNWKNKHINYIHAAYHQAQFFDEYKYTIYDYYNREWEYLVELNIWIIKDLAKILGIKMPQFIRSSEIEGVKGQKTDRVLDILEKLGADEDICRPGARSYLETQKFVDNGIKLYWYEFNHPVYPQLGEGFLPYLSVIDLIFNTGTNAINHIRKGTFNALKLEGES